MWHGKSYDLFQREYQFKSGCYLIEKLENLGSLENKATLDLGCGNGMLTHLLAGKTKRTVTAVDADSSMLAVLRETYGSSDIKPICEDIPRWLSYQTETFDLVFSNATFHWLGSHDSIGCVLKACFDVLTPGGILAVRFSLLKNALELKQYLAARISEFLNRPAGSLIDQSQLAFDPFIRQLKECGFHLNYSEEIMYTPFSNSDLDYQFMIHSQPIRGIFSGQSFGEFEQYLKQCWSQKQVPLKSHHAVILATKTSG